MAKFAQSKVCFKSFHSKNKKQKKHIAYFIYFGIN